MTILMLPLCLKKEMKELRLISILFLVSTCFFTAGLGYQIFQDGYIFNSKDQDDPDGNERILLDQVVLPAKT